MEQLILNIQSDSDTSCNSESDDTKNKFRHKISKKNIFMIVKISYFYNSI